MPLYQYQCRECGFDLEARQKFSDEPLKVCPNCGAEQGLYRVVQAAGIVFKGSGFYVTDSRGNRENLTSNGKKKAETTTGSEGTSSSSTTESSPAAKASDSTPAKTTSAAAAD